MNRDYDLPGGFQDADLEMRGMAEQANIESRLRRRGICTHGWSGPVIIGESARRCLHCGEVFRNDEELEEARYDALNP